MILGLVAVIVAACVGLMFLLGRSHDKSMAAAERAATADRQLLLGMVEYERAARKEASDKFASILNKMSEDHANELRQTMNMKALGVPVVGDAVVIPAKPDAEQRVGKMVREQTIETGARRLVEAYREQGVNITIEDARKEATLLLAGSMPSV